VLTKIKLQMYAALVIHEKAVNRLFDTNLLHEIYLCNNPLCYYWAVVALHTASFDTLLYFPAKEKIKIAL